MVVEAIRSSIQICSAFGLLIDDCKRLLSSLHNVFLCFVKRSSNHAAHYIARISRLLADRVITETCAPSKLFSVLMSDCSV